MTESHKAVNAIHNGIQYMDGKYWSPFWDSGKAYFEAMSDDETVCVRIELTPGVIHDMLMDLAIIGHDHHLQNSAVCATLKQELERTKEKR